MSRDPYAPPASEEEQFSEVARILGRALHRWHRLNRGKVVNADRPPDEPVPHGDSHPTGSAKAVQTVVTPS